MVFAKSGGQRHLLLAEEIQKNSTCTDGANNGTMLTCTNNDQCDFGKYCNDTNECTLRAWVSVIIALVILFIVVVCGCLCCFCLGVGSLFWCCEEAYERLEGN